MSIFSKAKNFFSRHRNKFMVTGIIISGSYILSKYARYKFKEWQEKEAIEFFDKNRKQSHFESIIKTSNQTFTNFSAALQDLISDLINTDNIIENLRSNPDNKVELWNSLKLLVFTKVGLFIYTSVMLIVIVNIQLMVIGGYLYKDNTMPTEIQEKYLSLSQNFLNSGVKKVAEHIETEMKKLVDNVELTKLLKLGDIENLYWSLQVSLSSLKDGPIEELRKYVLTNDNIPDSAELYDNILRDTADFLDSDEVKSLATHLINQGFILLGDQLAEFYSKDSPIGTTGKKDECFRNPFDIEKPLAKLLPLMNGIFSKQTFPVVFNQQLMSNKKLQTFSANVYESLL